MIWIQCVARFWSPKRCVLISRAMTKHGSSWFHPSAPKCVDLGVPFIVVIYSLWAHEGCNWRSLKLPKLPLRVLSAHGTTNLALNKESPLMQWIRGQWSICMLLGFTKFFFLLNDHSSHTQDGHVGCRLVQLRMIEWRYKLLLIYLLFSL